ncbi:MAG: cell surface protein SprA [Sphingobacteriales bacterium]|nr:MAG: cell surface protein SprA [Sphingobacteriales bacterium]
MKRTTNFGYKLLLFITLVVAIANAAAKGRADDYDFYEPEPQPDTPATNTVDTARKLRFPIYDNDGNPTTSSPTSIDLNDPSNVNRSVEYDPKENRYYFTEKMGDQFLRNPSYLTMDEYLKYQAQQDEQAYWKRRLDALTLFNKKPQLPTMYKEGVFNRIFGGDKISVRPQGNVDVTFGGNWQHIQNPTLPARQQRFGVFDFDMQMNVNLLATVGDKLKLNISNNTKATFDYQNVQKLEYTGKEDEIIKKIEAGSVSFPLNSSLISGVQSLFGLKTQLQFGKLWVTSVISQQRSKRNSLTIQGGSQTQQFAVKADEYEENRHFLLSQYFRNNYNNALKNYPIVASQVTINKIEVWITNRTGAVEGVRNVIGFIDLGENNPYRSTLAGASRPIINGLPDNRANQLYDRLLQDPTARLQSGVTTAAGRILGTNPTLEFSTATARKLNTTEFTFNPQLGYISLNTQLNPDDILAVAYRYTYNGRVFQVGEFSEDLPPSTSQNATSTSTDQKVLFLKLLKSTGANPQIPIWDLMMKNVYALGGLGVSKDEFRLNVLYQDPGGGEKRYIPEGPTAGVPLITLLNLDRLNYQNDPAPDGIFDFVEGITINTQQGKIIFPVLEPFGQDLQPTLGGSVQLERKYLYNILYDSTKTVARQFQQNNRYVIRGSYRSSSSSEIFLGGFNIPQGSVSVSAGGQRLAENVDYQIDYGLGRLKILNSGILNSGIPINVQYEDNATFGFQQQNFTGARFDYYLNNKMALGGTFMRLSERPFTQKTTFGEDPIKNTVLGLDANYQSETPGLTKLIDKLPLYSTTAPSFVSVSGEVAGLLPSHPRQINVLDPEGSVYVDDFEGTRGSYDLKFPAMAWTLASTPAGATDKNGNLLFKEATLVNDLEYGMNRAKLAWYFIEPQLIDQSGGVPEYVKKDPKQHYIRLVQQQEVFPQAQRGQLQSALSTLDLAFYPRERGPYNFDGIGLMPDGGLDKPAQRWGGIMRPIDNSDFEQSNVEFVEFWVMDPFIGDANAAGGSLYLNLGNVSEDVLKDSKKFFENGVTYPKNPSNLDKSRWGYTPKFQQQITRAFDTDPASRTTQDVGYDGLDNGEESEFFKNFVEIARNKVTDPVALQRIQNDPANDDYRYFRDAQYEESQVGILTRYKNFNGPHGNSPVTNANSAVSNAGTTVPESEDINRDNTLTETEDYYQYRIDFTPNMQVGQNYLINKSEVDVKLPNGARDREIWYQFKIPIREYSGKVGNISDFRSIRFMRLFLHGFQDSVIMRFARLELGRNNWRRYMFSLQNPGENIPEEDQQSTEFSVSSVSLEENSGRQPVNYVIPPGVNRQVAQVSNAQSVQLNEQALSLQVCNLKDGDARAVFKEVSVDMRQFGGLRMFIHAESQPNRTPIKDGDMRAIIRIGSDFTNNYYEYQMPLAITLPNSNRDEQVWPEQNRLDLVLNDLVAVKTQRNSQGLPSFVPYQSQDSKGNTIIVVGNPNIGDAKTIMLGVTNPKRSNRNPGDDGLPKCVEVWFNEMRMTGLNEKPGYAAAGKVSIQFADLANVNLSGSMHTQGYGNIDQKLNQRFRDNFYQYNASTNINLGKLTPRKWGLQLPLFLGYSQNTSNPQYDPYDLDVKFEDKLNSAPDAIRRDSIKKAAQDYTSISSFNLSNVRILGNPEKQSKPKIWSVKNFDVSYAYNKQFKRNPIVESDELVDQKVGLGYAYAIKARPIEPFKKAIKSRSRWMSLIKDINLNPVPANISFRTDLNRIFNETQVRNIGDAAFKIQPTYFKNFTWVRTYNVRWELTRSLSFDYSATNNSRIDEPYGRINTPEKRDTLWERIQTFGRNTYYTQSFNASYNLPLQKLPITDWTSVRFQYGANYSWTAASRLAAGLGNTIGNTQTKQINGEMNFAQLYQKNRWLRAVNQPRSSLDRMREQQKKEDEAKQKSTLRPSKPGEDKASAAGDKAIDLTKGKARKNDSTNIAENTSKLTNVQLDSVRKAQKAAEVAKKAADKAKRKKDRIAARNKRRNTTPEVGTWERFGGRMLTMVKRTTLNYTENSGTLLPGYMDSTRILGINDYSGAPGFNFIYGYQPDRAWLETQASASRLSRDSLFNAQFQQQYSQSINANATLEPIQDFRIDVSLTQTFSKAYNELFKDTSLGGNGSFTHNNPYETGSFSVSYIGLKTMFKSSGGINSSVYQDFLRNREVVSSRLGASNPYAGNIPDPNDPAYKKGYNRYAQDVLVPSFLAAYTGKSANDVAMIDNKATQNVRSNPFRYFLPMPNWRITYNGLTKIPAVSKIMTNLVVNHGYTGTMAMNSFVSTLFYQDIYSLGFPSFLDSNSGNFVPFFQVPNITISEQLNPLLGFDAAFRNRLTGRFEFRKTRTVSLSLVDYQISETKSTEYVIGGGYRIRGLILPFEIFGVRKLNNDLNVRVDIGLRDDKTSNNYLAQNISVDTRGQKVITISPSVDYIVNDKLTIRAFYDRRQSIPYVTTSYPITTTRAGITLRFIFAQ